MRAQPFRIAAGLLAVVLSYAATLGVAWAQGADAAVEGLSQAGRVEFDHPGGGQPNVQVDLPAGLWSDVVGLGDAAVAGVVESLLQPRTSDGAPVAEVKLAADQLAGIRAIMSALQGAVGEVRVRVYEGDEPDQTAFSAVAVADFYAKKLAQSKWAKIVQVREDDDAAIVFILHEGGAIHGVFVVASDGSDLALVNVLCDVSPDRVKQITRAATNIGMELGGEDAVREILRELRP